MNLATAIQGMSRYVLAKALNQLVPADVANQRLRTHCVVCAELTVGRVPLFGAGVATCGKPADEVEGKRCGCVVGWVPPEIFAQLEAKAGGDKERLRQLIIERLEAEGKTTCTAEGVGRGYCPQGKW